MIDICLISDFGYVDYLYTCVKSLKLSKKEESKYSIHLLFDMNDEEFIAAEKKLSQLSSKNFHVECIQQSSEKYSIFERDDFHVKAADLLKFDLMNIFSYLNKILYLDSDIIVKDDLSELFETDLNGYYFAANYHATSTDEVKHRTALELKHVYNAGVLLFNLKKMRLDNLYDTLIHTRSTHPYILNARSLDQLTFNLCCKDAIKEFNPKFHIMFRNNWDIKLYNNTYGTNFKTFTDVIEDSSIIHFVGKDCKPWFEDAKAAYLWKCCNEFDDLSALKLYDSSNIHELKQETRNVIVFSFDKNVINPAIVAMSSMLQETNTRTKTQIVCLTAPDVSIFDRAKIYYYLNKLNKPFILNFVNTEDVLDKNFEQAFVIRGITKPAYYRLFLDRILPEFRYVIYSDIDVVFKKNVFNVFNITDQTNVIFAVPSVSLSSKSQFINNKWQYYFNSGFLVINIDKLKSENKSDEIFAMIPQNYVFQDQDIMNKVFKGKIGRLPPTYCLIPNAYLSKDSEDNRYVYCCERGIFSGEEVNQLVEPNIIHYAGPKPWIDNKIFLADEWIAVFEKIFGITYYKDEITQKQLDVRNGITRTKLVELIGKEHLITRIAGVRSFQLNLKEYKIPFVIRSFDFEEEIVFRDEDDLKSVTKLKKLINLKKKSKIVFVEKYLQGAINVTAEANEQIYSEDYISFEVIDKIVKLSKILFGAYKEYSKAEFLVVNENLYFKRLTNE